MASKTEVIFVMWFYIHDMAALDQDESDPDIRLRPVRHDDEDAFTRANHAFAGEGFAFGLAYEAGMEWTEYLDLLERHQRGEGLPNGWVPATFLVAVLDDVIVGRTSIRHRLTEALTRVGGHVGYGVVSDYRRRGIATQILSKSLEITDKLGIERVLMTCNDDNVASSRVIERCGGRLDSVVTDQDGTHVRRYWVDRAR